MGDVTKAPLLSICIPSYNRPEQLDKLLASIDCSPELIEVVICEDNAPRRQEVRNIVDTFRQHGRYKLVYEENHFNLGYDANLRHLVEIASGSFVLFMGDDDWFVEGNLDKFITFLQKNSDVGYVLRSYFAMHPDGTLEPFRYLPVPKRFSPSIETCAWLYKRTVSIAGVTFQRESALKYSTDQFDGTLLYQLHLVLEICFNEESIYSDLPVAIVAQTFREDKPQFGVSNNEKSRFIPGKVTASNSVNFTKGFFEIACDFDRRNGVNLTALIRKDLSKYSYPFLSIQRKRGLIDFLRYSFRLAQETGLNSTWHFYFYTLTLLIFGERICDKVILLIKRQIGYTPQF